MSKIDDPKKKRDAPQSQLDQGLAFRLLRVVKGISQAQLAKAVGKGTSTSSVSDWEKGKVAPREESVDRLLAGMDLPRPALDAALTFIAALSEMSNAYPRGSTSSDIAESDSAYSSLLATNPAFRSQIEHLSLIAERAAAGLTIGTVKAICTFLGHGQGSPDEEDR